MNLTLHVWRQASPTAKGRFARYPVRDVSTHASFLEMLDVLNERLIREGAVPIAFDHDCREGICGACSLVVDGQAHGPEVETTVCQLHMRHYSDGATIHVEPFRANAFPVVRDLVVDRSALDRIISAGGFISTHTGSAADDPSEQATRRRLERAARSAVELIGAEGRRPQDAERGAHAAALDDPRTLAAVLEASPEAIVLFDADFQTRIPSGIIISMT